MASLKRGWDLHITQKGDYTYSMFHEVQACLTRGMLVPATEAAQELSWEARAGGDRAAWDRNHQEDEWLTLRDTCPSSGPGNEGKMGRLGQKTSERGYRGNWVSHMCANPCYHCHNGSHS